MQIQKNSVEHTPGTGVRSRNPPKNGLVYVFVGIPQNITVIWVVFRGILRSKIRRLTAAASVDTATIFRRPVLIS